MIRVMNAELNRLGVVRNVIKASRVEQLNGENTLAFSAVLDTALEAYINSETIFELQGEYFDIAAYEKFSNDDGTYTVDIEAEQISYRLNQKEYNVTDFESEGSPKDILALILSGTGFKAGVVDFTGIFKYEAGGEVSRRQLLMQFATALKGELIFEKFTIGLLKHRGSIERVPVVKDQHVKVVSQMLDKRNLMPNGDYQVVYNCESVYLPSDHYALGDDIKLMERRLNIFEDLRVVSITYNPYNEMETSLTFANGPLEYYGRGIERAMEEQSHEPQESWDNEKFDERFDERFDEKLEEDIDPRIEDVFEKEFDNKFDDRFDVEFDDHFDVAIDDYFAENPISSGHEIIDPNGFYLPQQPKLQFTGNTVTVRDDSENSTTLVEITSGSGGEHNHVYIDHMPTQDETWDVGTEVSVYDPDNSHLNAGVLYPITHSFIVVDKKNEIVEDLENFDGEILECFNTAPGAWRYYDGYPPDSRVIVAAKPGDIIEVSMMYAHTELSSYLADNKEAQEYVYIRIWPSMWLTEDWGGGERGFKYPAYGLGDVILSGPWAFSGRAFYGIATSANKPMAEEWRPQQYPELDKIDVKDSIGTSKQIKKLTYKFTVTGTGHFDEIVAYEKSKGTFSGDPADYMLGVEVRACANILVPEINKPKDTVFWLYESKVTYNGVPIETANTNPFNNQGQLNVKYEGITPDNRLFSSGQRGERIISDSYKNEPWSRYPHLT